MTNKKRPKASVIVGGLACLTLLVGAPAFAQMKNPTAPVKVPAGAQTACPGNVCPVQPAAQKPKEMCPVEKKDKSPKIQKGCPPDCPPEQTNK